MPQEARSEEFFRVCKPYIAQHPFLVYEKSAKQGSDDRQLSLGFRSDLILRCLQYFRALGDGLMDQLVLTPEPLIITTSPSPVLWPLFSQGPSTPRLFPPARRPSKVVALLRSNRLGNRETGVSRGKGRVLCRRRERRGALVGVREVAGSTGASGSRGAMTGSPRLPDGKSSRFFFLASCTAAAFEGSDGHRNGASRRRRSRFCWGLAL